MYHFLLATCLYATSLNASTASEFLKNQSVVQADSVKYSDWLGFKRAEFTVNGRKAIIISPKKAASGKPWIWRTEFFGHEPQGDSMLAAKGFHVVYLNVEDMYGAPKALDHMDRFYEWVRKHKKLEKKVVLEGFSRGGLFAMNWAARNPEKTSCIYLDAPVCDFKRWPGDKKEEFAEDWNKLKKAYGFQSDEEAYAYQYNPLDNLSPIAKFKIPILSVCGTADHLVELAKNSGLMKTRYEALGGKMDIIAKEGVGHHPHSLKDPTPIVEFILKNRIR